VKLIRAPCASMISRDIVKLRPLPVMPLSGPRKNPVKMRGWCSVGS
jgi:hypothetical protein